MEQGAEKVLVLFLAVDLLRSWMVQLRLLYWVSYGVDLLGEKVFVPFISFGFAFVGPGSNTWIFYIQCKGFQASFRFGNDDVPASVVHFFSNVR
jgi:hypothetical protein